LGGQQGIKASVVLYAIFTGWGGWFLGRVLGLGSLGRVLLGLLLVGKGYTFAALNAGFFQLAASQAYMPWITAGIVGIFRQPDRRWPPCSALSCSPCCFGPGICGTPSRWRSVQWCSARSS
jgi:hypothetical protein